jgi:hypothetical protein
VPAGPARVFGAASACAPDETNAAVAALQTRADGWLFRKKIRVEPYGVRGDV